MSTSDVMPLPGNATGAAGRVAGDLTRIGQALTHTQIASRPLSEVPGWSGEAASAYLGEAQGLKEHTLRLAERFPQMVEVLRTWGAASEVAATVTVPALWERYDEAASRHLNACADLRDEVEAARASGTPIPEDDVHRKQASLDRTLRSDQSDILREYRRSMDVLDDEAQTAASALRGVLASVIDPALVEEGREAVGASLFEGMPLVDGQAEWEHAQYRAAQAARLLTSADLTPDDLKTFVREYGVLCSDPFFATALSERLGPGDMLQLLMRMSPSNGNTFTQDGQADTEFDESFDRLLGDLGSALVLSTGGMNADPSAAPAQVSFALVRAGLLTGDGSSVDTLVDRTLDEIKEVGRTYYRSDGAVIGEDEQRLGRNSGEHHGYEFFARLLGRAAEDNTNLALGSEFLGGADSVARDLVAWDHEHLEELTSFAEYGDRSLLSRSGTFSFSTSDPLTSMMRLMDEPTALSDGSLRPGDGVREALENLNSQRLDAVRDFLTSDTPFPVGPQDGPVRVPPLTRSEPMGMTRYLTGHRQSDFFPGWTDQGDAFGRTVAQASSTVSAPEGLDRDSPEYRTWSERNRDGADIAGNFLLGYQEGIEIDNGLYRGEDQFGATNSLLRSWAGTILAPHVEGITNSLRVATSSEDFYLRAPQGNDGWLLELSPDLADRIIGRNGLFTDLAFDAPLHDNGTPDDPSDDVYLTGRPPAIQTLLMAAKDGYEADLDDALRAGDIDAFKDSQIKWAHVMNDLTVAPSGASEEVGKAIDAQNAALQDLVAKGVGMVPFAQLLGDGHDATKWLIDQAKGIALPATLDNLLATNHADLAVASGVEAHNGLESYMSQATMSALARNTEWGDDPMRTPQAFLENTQDPASSFLDRKGDVLPLHKMTLLQQQTFMDFIKGPQGQGPTYLPVLDQIQQTLNDAERERREAVAEAGG
jgi:hypothetical protein